MAVDVGSAVGHLDLDISGFMSGLQQADAASSKTANSISAKMNKGIQSISSGMNSVGGMVKSTGTAISTLGKAFSPVTLAVTGLTGAAVKTTVSFTKLYESTMVVFEKMLGGKKAAGDLYDSLLSIAKASTFSQEAFLQAGKGMVGMGVDAQSTTKYMQAITDAVAGFGGTSENLTNVATAFSKISTSGKMSGEDINRLSDNGIQALKILGNSYGKTTDEMRKMISEGTVPAKDALDILSNGIENGTDGVNGMTAAMAGMSLAMKGKTLTGALDSLNSGFRAFALNLIGINPTLKENAEGYEESQKRLSQLTAIVSTIAGLLPKLSPLFQGITDALGKLLDMLIGTNAKFNEATGTWENIGGILGKVNEVLSDPSGADGVKKMAGAITAMATAGATLPVIGKVTEKFGSSIQGASKIFQKSGTEMVKFGGQLVNDVKGIGKGLGDVGESIAMPLQLGLQNVGPEIKNGFSNFFSGQGGFFSQKAGLFVKQSKLDIDNISNGLKDGLINMKAKFNVSANGFKEGVSSIMDKLPEPIKNAGNKIGDTLGSLGNKVTSGFSSLGKGISYYGPSIANGFKTVGTGAISFMGSMAKLAGVGSIIALVVAGLGMLNNSMGGELDNMIMQIATKIPQMVNDLVVKITGALPQMIQSGGDMILAILNGLTIALPSILNGAAQIISTLVTSLAELLPTLIPAAVQMVITLVLGLIQNLPLIIEAGIQLLQGLITGLINAIPQLITMLPQIITTIVTVLTQNLPMILQMGITLLVEIINGLVNAIPQLITMLPQIISTIVQVLTQNLPTILQMGITLLVELINGLVNAIPQLISYLPQIISTIVQVLTQNLPLILAAGIQVIIALIQGLIQAIPQLIGALPQIINSIINTFKNTNWGSIGLDIIRGIASGLASAGHMLWDTVKGILGNFKDNVLSFFGIESPSRWGRLEVGRWIPPGIAGGFVDAMPTAANEMQESIDDEMSKITTPDIDASVNTSTDGIGDLTNTIQQYYLILYGFLDMMNTMIGGTAEQLAKTSKVMSQPQIGVGIGYEGNDSSVISKNHSETAGGLETNNTYIFNTDRPIDEIEAARQLKKAQQDLAEGF